MKKRDAKNDLQFASFDLDPRVLAELAALGYEEPTPVQREAIPPLLAGRDLLGQAATGTGKTAAFALPLLQRLTPDAPPRERTVALILVPTRELAMQVAEAVHRYGRGLGVQVLPIYGGAPMETQLRALKRGVDVVVATPGRALDHIRRKSLRLASVRVLVLDEADEMLDMGFAEDLEAIIAATPAERQTALFSATLPPRITAIAAAHLRDPVHVRIDREVLPAGDAPKVRQVVYMVSRANKKATLGRILDIESPVATIVFCRTRTEVDDLTEMLNGRGLRAEALHGGLSQDQRDRVMKRFRAHTTDLLIATDVAARGLDVPHVSHVINYDVPSAAEAYVHRIGRTGRAHREGVAITLAEPRERGLLRNIERLTTQRIEIATVPTVADLRAHRLEQTRDELRATILAGDLDAYRAVAESLTAEFDALDIAAAALKQGGGRDGAELEEEIPIAAARDAPPRTRNPRRERDRSETRAPRAASDVAQPIARVFIGAGRKAKVRPGDLVGAIANEAGIDAGSIGAVRITDRYSLVEVPEGLADDVIAALQATKIKGKRVEVRRDRDVR
ncbi:MAG TPA: DEAD/DEAH box helicase [Gemmatimonadaceae bacterium]|nr:DEAD/DEAH box helicase [Gemmatimonadaceae bacterium]